MRKNKYPKKKWWLEDTFLNELTTHSEVSLLSNNKELLHLKIDDLEFYAFLKFISPEGKPHPVEHQRAQLPYKDRFAEVLESDKPFFFIGYDYDNNVYVTWSPAMVKPRLNKKKYVSFYSRLSSQLEVEEGKILVKKLKNNDRYVLAKGADIIELIRNYEYYFNCDIASQKSTVPTTSSCNVSEKEVMSTIDSFPHDAPIFDIVQKCMNKHRELYPKWSLHKWHDYVTNYIQNGRHK